MAIFPMDEDQKSLTQYLDEVINEKTFLAFMDALMRDFVESNDEWQNDTIDNFLECGHAWAVDSFNGLLNYKKPENPWKRCAEILYMGKIYE